MATSGVLSVKLLGHDGRFYSKPYQLAEVSDATPAAEIATLINRGDAIATALADVTDMGLVSATIAVDIGVTPVADNDGRANRQAEIALQLATAVGKKAVVGIPGAADTIFVGDSPSSDVVDVADADLLTYLNALADFTTVSDGESIEDPLVLFGGKRVDKAFRPKAD